VMVRRKENTMMGTSNYCDDPSFPRCRCIAVDRG
jgi:hypothetical protein